MNLRLLTLILVVAGINFERARADEVKVETPVEEIGIFIDLTDSTITDKEFVCETLGKLLTDPSQAPWGLVAATNASCDANAKELEVRPHELWRLRVVGTANDATWTIERPLNPAGLKKLQPAWKTEAVQVLTANEKVRQSFYANKKSLTIFLAATMQQLPFFRVDSALIKNNEDRDIGLPPWPGNLDSVYVCLVNDWQLFSIDLRNETTNKKTTNTRKLCEAKNTWKVSSVERGSLTKPMADILKADLDALTVIFNEAQKTLTTPKNSPKIPKFGVSASVGIQSNNTELTYGAANSFTFTGVDTSLMAEYYPNKLQILSLGLNFYRATATILVANSAAEINLTQAGLYLRVIYGINSDVINNYRLVLTPFLDYGLSGSYKIEDKTGTNTYKFMSSLKYGGIAGLEYLLTPRLKIGVNANLTMGSFRLGEDYIRATNKTANLMGLGGALYLGWNN